MSGEGVAETARVSVVQRFVFGLDRWLQRSQDVFEYSDRPDCVFRIQRTLSSSSYVLSDGVAVREGDPIIELHLWNEHMPRMDAAGGGIGWGSRLNHGFRDSLAELSGWLDARPEFDDFKVVYANMALGGRERTEGLVAKLCKVLGLERIEDGHKISLGEHLRRFGENILGLMLSAASNPAAARLDMLARSRARLAISRGKLRANRARWEARR